MSQPRQSEDDGRTTPRERLRPALIRTAWIAGAVALVVCPLAARVAFEGRAELARADDARDSGRVDLEIVHLGRAARWRLPIATHDERALERLLEIGAEQEEIGNGGLQLSLGAYREVRRALISTRAWGVPHREWLDEANRHIAALMASQERMLGMDLSGTGEQEAYHLELLDELPGPDPVRANLAALAFIAWLSATVGFVFRALDARGKLRPKTALRWGGASIVLLIAWMLLLRFAG